MNKVEPHYTKTDLKIFVIVIPKEGLAGISPANPSFGMISTIVSVISYRQCHINRSLVWDGASQALFWYNNNKDLKIWFCMMQLSCLWWKKWHKRRIATHKIIDIKLHNTFRTDLLQTIPYFIIENVVHKHCQCKTASIKIVTLQCNTHIPTQTYREY